MHKASKDNHNLRADITGFGLPHDSAQKHVTGLACYIDDIETSQNCIHLAPFYSKATCGTIKSIDLQEAMKQEGVVDILLANAIPGVNDCSPSIGGDPILADGEILFHGQVVGVVLAKSHLHARRAARYVQIVMDKAVKPPAVTIEEGVESLEDILPPYRFERGDVDGALTNATKQFSSSMRVGGQEHFYLEGQVALAMPKEDGNILVYSSTQHPDGNQRTIAAMLNLPMAAVICECRRMGGAFGGKESQSFQWSCLAALAAYKTGRMAKLRLDRDDDMMMTGKRHDFRIDYRVCYDHQGKIEAVCAELLGRCGYSLDLSQGVIDRAMFHADNAYFYPQLRISSRFVRTNTVSNTAFRGFGGPQGVMLAERLMDSIAILENQDPLDIRLRNLYGPKGDVTPYGMKVRDRFAKQLICQLAQDCHYRKRRQEIGVFNSTSQTMLRGIALTPVKFGISFTLKKLNQASALVHVFSDGSIEVNHGGTEMGQGLHTKIMQIVADVFGVKVSCVHIGATRTDKVANAAPTAASSGFDLNGMVAQQAAKAICARLANLMSKLYQTDIKNISFKNGMVYAGKKAIPFADLTLQAVMDRVSLSQTAHYATPKITWERDKVKGRPFLYFAWGAAVSEVLIDRLTGEVSVEQVDILHDVGCSVNPAIDIGQIEGGFVQGQGWLTTEELVYHNTGQLLTHAPSTYKIPTSADIAKKFNVRLWDKNFNTEPVIYRSKAVGEPPLMLAISVFSAITHAIASLQPRKVPVLDSPATPHAILSAINSQLEKR